MSKIDLLKSKVVRNASWLIAGKIAQMIISLFVGLLTARYLGPSNYGLIGYAGAYVAFLTIFCNLGINSVLVKEFIDNPGQEGKILGTTIGLRALSTLLSYITLIVVVFLIDGNEPLTICVVALSSLGLFFRVFESFNYWFQSRLQSKVTAIASLIAYSITAAYKIYLLIDGASVVFFALVSSIEYVCLGILLFYQYKKNSGSQFSFSWEYAKSLLGKSYHFILPSIMVAIYGQTDKLMMKQMISESEIGFYVAACTICAMWCFILSAIIDSMYPPIMEAHGKDEEQYNRLNRQLYAIVFYVSVFVSAGIALLAEPIVYILYGSSYLPAVEPLRIITWYTAFSYLGVARNAWIVSENKQKYLFRIYVSAAVANVALNLVLIPVWGASGAAVASLVAQIVTTLIAPFFIKELRQNSILMLQAIFLRGVFNPKK